MHLFCVNLRAHAYTVSTWAWKSMQFFKSWLLVIYLRPSWICCTVTTKLANLGKVASISFHYFSDASELANRKWAKLGGLIVIRTHYQLRDMVGYLQIWCMARIHVKTAKISHKQPISNEEHEINIVNKINPLKDKISHLIDLAIRNLQDEYKKVTTKM